MTHGLYVRDNQNIVMSDFYVEQAENGFFFEGGADDPPGRATITGAKFQSFTSTDVAKNNVFEIHNYHGEIAIGPYQFYQEPKLMRMKQTGERAVDVLLWGSSWYGVKPDPQLGPPAQLFAAGNDFFGEAPAAAPATEETFFKSAPTANNAE